ncbi:hypothetical protein M3Y99_00907100 [Aphelenchoides fujianensis]|nr:hypothetical protein M3Y99_00907100 [Aphelenchoides fujianensis]
MKTIRKFGFDLAHDTRHDDEVHEGDRCHPCVPFFGIVLIILVAAARPTAPTTRTTRRPRPQRKPRSCERRERPNFRFKPPLLRCELPDQKTRKIFDHSAG